MGCMLIAGCGKGKDSPAGKVGDKVESTEQKKDPGKEEEKTSKEEE